MDMTVVVSVIGVLAAIVIGAWQIALARQRRGHSPSLSHSSSNHPHAQSVLPEVRADLVDIYLERTRTAELASDFLKELQHCKANPDYVLSQKFMYTGLEEAYAWASLCSDPGYKTYRDSLRLFDQKLNAILDSVYDGGTDPIALVALGVGSGGKETLLLRAILERQPQLIFYPVDSSVEMLCLSLIAFIKNVSEYRGNISFKGILGDFRDLPPIRAIHNSGSRRYLFVFLGNTIGNDQEKDFLGPIGRLMGENDLLLVDSQLIQWKHDFESAKSAILPSYDLPRFKRFVTSPLKKLGFDPDRVGKVDAIMRPNHPYDLTWSDPHEKAYTVYYDFVFNQDVDVAFAESPLAFKTGQRMRLGHSVKYTVEALESIVANNGFKPTGRYVLTPERAYGAVLARKAPG